MLPYTTKLMYTAIVLLKNLLFRDFPVAVAIVVFVSSLGSFGNIDDDDEGRRPVKQVFIFYPQMLQLGRTVQLAYRSENLIRLNMLSESVEYILLFTLSKIRTTLSFHVVVLQRTAKKCTKI